MLVQGHRLLLLQAQPAVARDRLHRLEQPQDQVAVVVAVDLLRPLPAALQAVLVWSSVLLTDFLHIASKAQPCLTR